MNGFYNSILHAFGWAIVIEFKNDKELRVYPARVKYRGFSEESSSKSYKRIAKYMQENAEELLKEVEE